jgi:hypothetical protein
MTTTIETYGVIDFYAISSARGIDRPDDVIRLPITAFMLLMGGTGHAFLHFHKYSRTTVSDGYGYTNTTLTDLENYYIGFHPTGPGSPTRGCTGHTQDNSRYMEAIQRGRGTTEDYSGSWYFARNTADWNAAVGRRDFWNARNYYKLIDCDCTTYALDVARHLQLRVPIRSTLFNSLPYQAIDSLIALNTEPYRGPMLTETQESSS